MDPNSCRFTNISPWPLKMLAPNAGMALRFIRKSMINRCPLADIVAIGSEKSCFAERSRAFVQVQQGCDHRCTFCVIPFGRGNSRSVPAGDVVRQISRLVENGYLEVVLTGVDLTSYGKDLPGIPSLGRLVRTVLRDVPDLPRLRLSSIDSIEADDALMTAIAESMCRIVDSKKDLTPQAVDILGVHMDALKLVIGQRLSGDGGEVGARLMNNLLKAAAKAA